MKIEPIFIARTATDICNADGTLRKPKGSAVAYMSILQTKKFGDFSLLIPNPAHLFIASADHLISEIQKETESINESEKIIVFSKLVNGVNKYTTDELLKLDPNATKERSLEQDKLYRYLWLSSTCFISLIAAVEAFANKEIPKEHQCPKRRKGLFSFLQKPRILKKKDIEREMRLEEKISLLGEILSKRDYKQQGFWQGFKKIKSLRDSLVHLKTEGSNKVNRHDKLFKEIMEFDFKKHRDSVVSLLNYFIPNYIKD